MNEVTETRLSNNWKFYFTNTYLINKGEIEEDRKIIMRAYFSKCTKLYTLTFTGFCFEAKMDSSFTSRDFKTFLKQLKKYATEYNLELKKMANV